MPIDVSCRLPQRSTRVAVHRLGALAVASAACLGTGASAQGTGSTGVTIVPLFTISQSLTDNRKLSSTDRQADLITQISPGVQITSRSGALQGTLSYTANGTVYARDSGASTLQNQLSASGTADLIDRRFSLSGQATIGQQAVSAFDVQSPTPALNTANRSEVMSYSLTPLLKGRLLGAVDYQARVTYSATRSSGSNLGDSSGLNGSVDLAGTLGRLGWGIDVSRNGSRFDDGRSSYTGRAGASLNFAPDPEVRLSLRLARESSDLSTTGTSHTVSWGGGVNWAPTPRTTFSVDADRRYFGDSHSITAQHRFARSIWTYTDSRSVTNGGVSGGGRFSLYDLYFAQFASEVPDPVKRDVFVRQYLNFFNLDPNTVTSGGFLSGGSSVQRRQNLAVSFQGQRSTLTLSGYTSTSTSLGAAATGSDLSRAGEVQQLGYNVTVSYRLTPTDAVTILVADQRTLDAGTVAGNGLRTLSASWKGAVGRLSQVSLGLRYAVFDADLNPYHETALFGSLSLRF